jgi:hypothetical protein
MAQPVSAESTLPMALALQNRFISLVYLSLSTKSSQGSTKFTWAGVWQYHDAWHHAAQWLQIAGNIFVSCPAASMAAFARYLSSTA